MWKKAKNILAMGLAAVLLLAGCGASGETDGGSPSGQESNAGSQGEQLGAGGTDATGRYMESGIELPTAEELGYALDLRLGSEGVEFIAGDGTLYRSTDQGQSWQPVSYACEELRERLEEGTCMYYWQNRMGDVVAGYIFFQEDEEGNTDFGSADYVHALYLADGSSIPLDVPQDEFVYTAVSDEEGVFYLGTRSRVYRVNGDGSLEVLTELSGHCDYLTVCGRYLMLQGTDLQIYDLEENKPAEQDAVLSELLQPWLGMNGDVGSKPYLLYMPQGEEQGLYVLTEKGLYHHTLYGSTAEQLIDGSLCSMSNPMVSFVSMAQVGDTFWVLYSGSTLKQYTYDSAASAVPEKLLRVWGLYENEDIGRAVSAFGQTHPDIYITYEHPLSEDTGMTREDAMKLLSTELAAGNAPDVLILDELPYDSYVEKGVLADLTAALDSTGERYMEAVREAYQRDGGQYAMPMSLSVPVLMGAADQIQGVHSLEQLAELAETARASQPEGSLFGFGRARDALELLAAGSSGSWMDESGGVNIEAVREFLTLAGRIYDAQISGLTARELEAMEARQMYVDGKPVTRTEAGYQISNAMFFNQPYSMGMVESNLSVTGGYSSVAEMLRLQGMELVAMPGQSRLLGNASGILAVNEASKVKEQALELVVYALSAQFACESYVSGGFTNWDALDARAAKEQEDEMCVMMSFEDINGDERMIEIGAPSPEAIETLKQLLESCQGVSRCDSRVYDAVIEEGQKTLSGELTVEDALKAIEKQVALYLAE